MFQSQKSSATRVSALPWLCALFAQAGQPPVISASAGRNLSLFICLISTILGLCTSNNEPIVPWADIRKITPSIASKTKDWLNKPTYDLLTVFTE